MYEIVVVVKGDTVTEVFIPKGLRGKVRVIVQDFGFDKDEPSEESFE